MPPSWWRAMHKNPASTILQTVFQFKESSENSHMAGMRHFLTGLWRS
jgi:hypothetical protein